MTAHTTSTQTHALLKETYIVYAEAACQRMKEDSSVCIQIPLFPMLSRYICSFPKLPPRRIIHSGPGWTGGSMKWPGPSLVPPEKHTDGSTASISKCQGCRQSSGNPDFHAFEGASVRELQSSESQHLDWAGTEFQFNVLTSQ